MSSNHFEPLPLPLSKLRREGKKTPWSELYVRWNSLEFHVIDYKSWHPP